eukprot:gene2068-biopygen22943
MRKLHHRHRYSCGRRLRIRMEARGAIVALRGAIVALRGAVVAPLGAAVALLGALDLLVELGHVLLHHCKAGAHIAVVEGAVEHPAHRRCSIGPHVYRLHQRSAAIIHVLRQLLGAVVAPLGVDEAPLGAVVAPHGVPRCQNGVPRCQNGVPRCQNGVPRCQN